MTTRLQPEAGPDDCAPAPEFLLRGKVLPPSLAPGVPRVNLCELMDRERAGAVTTLTAPAGFGKTVLLVQYVRHRDSIPTAWLSLDPGDRRPEQFLAYLRFALEQAGLDTSSLQHHNEALLPGAGPIDALSGLIHLLEQAGPLNIVLDGFHRAESADLVALVQCLLDNLPPGCHLLVASRFPTGLSTADLLLNGRALSLVERDLRFTADEALQLFGARWPTEQVLSLHERCAGWPAALQLAHMTADQKGRIAGGELLTGSGLAAYLTQQVMIDVDPEEERFILETAVLRHFDPGFADYVRGRDDSRHLLRRLARMSPLLEVDDGQYCYHGLLREYLLDRLRESQPQRFSVLCGRASDWLEKHGQVNRAVETACFAGDYRRAVDIIQRAGGWRILLQFGPDLLQRVLSHFSGEVISQFDELQICRFFLLLKDGQFAEARRRIDEWQMTKSVPVYPEYPDMMEITYEMYTDLPVSDESAARTTAMIRRLPHSGAEELHAILRTTQVIQLLSLGRLEEARSSAQEGMQYLRQTDLRYALNFFYFHLGMLQVLACDIERARDHYQAGTELARREFGELYRLPSVGQVLLAETHYLSNELSECHALLEDALQYVTVHDGWCEMYIAAYTTAVRLAYTTDGLDAALTAADQCQAVADERRLDRLAATAQVLRAESLARSGLLQSADRTLDAMEITLPDDWRQQPFFWQLQHLELLVRLRITLARQHWDRGRQLLEAASPPRAPLHALERALWETGMLAAQGRLREASLKLLPLVDTLAHYNLPRLVLDTGESLLPPITALLQQQEVEEPECLAFLARLLVALGGNPDTVRRPLEDALSDREFQVLELLAQGHPNKLIARHLGTSENTIKFHLKNVFRKLGVTRRVAAIRVAREQGLLH